MTPHHPVKSSTGLTQRHRRGFSAFGALAALALTGCGGNGAPASNVTSTADAQSASGTGGAAGDTAEAVFVERIDAIQSAVTAWTDAATLADATTAAETAANLVVGPNGPGYGDRNGDGVVSGETSVGLLSGMGGTPEGIAVPLASNECVSRDVLGGTATDVDAGWAQMDATIAAWTPTNNTMPTLVSHPMRVVGWATFTIGSDSLDDAHEYASHAQLHVDVARNALAC